MSPLRPIFSLPNLSPAVASAGKIETSTLPNGVKVISSEAGKVSHHPLQERFRRGLGPELQTRG
jgi:hypothetical protein